MKKIFVAGHNGMVGRSISKLIVADPNSQIISRSREELNLCDFDSVLTFLKNEKPDEIIIAAAKVGGILANNSKPAEFIYENLQIQNNLIHCAHIVDIQKLLFLGSSCIYPKNSPQPIKEKYLLTDLLEKTNEPYAIAKIAGIKMCESYNRQYGRDYRSIMPTNLYGPFDNFDENSSHVIPGLIGRFYRAKMEKKPSVEIWGTGMPRREFLFVEDLAEASLFIHNLPFNKYQSNCQPMQSHINIGTGEDISIKELALLIKDLMGFKGKIYFNTKKPDGTMLKKLDVNLINSLGWQSKTSLRDGLEKTIEFYLNSI